MSDYREGKADFKIRLPNDLLDWLKLNSEKNYRTVTAEINMHLAHAKARIENQSGTKKADDTVESNSSASTKSQAKGI